MMRLFLVIAVLIAIARRRQLAAFVSTAGVSERMKNAKLAARQIMDLFRPSKGIFSDEAIAEYNRRHSAEADQS